MSVVCLVAPEPSSSVSAGISTSGKNSTSGSMFIFRPPLARDLVTMAEDGPAPGRVTAGIAAVAVGAVTESDLPDRSVQPTLRLGSESISITGKHKLRKICAACRSQKMTFHSHGKLKTLGFLRGNEGIDRGNLTLTVEILSVKSRN